MSNGKPQSWTPDLFSKGWARDPSSQSANPFSSTPAITHPATASSSPRHILPSDLPTAIEQLEDGEVDRFLSAVLPSRSVAAGSSLFRMRARASGCNSLDTREVERSPRRLKAGLTPSRMARQFGISQADVRKAFVRS